MAVARAGRYAGQFGGNLVAALEVIARSHVDSSWTEVLAGADSIHYGTRRLREEAITDALQTGADWWPLGEVLRMHPQAAYDGYGNLHNGARTPAQHRPHLAVLLTAGLVDVHHPCPEYGLDLDAVATPGTAADPRVVQVRSAAAAQPFEGATGCGCCRRKGIVSCRPW